jgi:hypothetical protein
MRARDEACSSVHVSNSNEREREVVMGDDEAMKCLAGRGRVAKKANVLVGTMIATLSFFVLVASAGAVGFGVEPGSFLTTVSTNQAGAHPDMRTAFVVAADANAQPIGGTVKDIRVELPKGVLAAANATPTCPMKDVVEELLGKGCPRNTAVGVVTVLIGSPTANSANPWKTLVYNVAPTPDEPAAFAFNATFPVRLDAAVRSDSDYGVTTTTSNLTEAAYPMGADLTLWGVPADHNGPGPEFAMGGGPFGGPGDGARLPFTINPTECSSTPLTSSIALDSWQHPGVFSTDEASLGTIIGCDRLAFSPSFDLRPDTREAGVPAGFTVDLKVPQNPEPAGLASPDVKDVKVQMPEGVTLSPGAADGLQACSNEQVGLGSLAEPSCPSASKIGSVTVQTPLLDKPLTGSVYLGTQLSSDPLSGQMVRMFLVAQGSGVMIKQPGSVVVDPVTGRLTTSFTNNPQLPFSDLQLTFNGGPRAPLSTPSACGTYTTQAEITPWSSDVASHSDPSFVVDGNCAQVSQFTPSLEAGLVSPVAGSSSPLGVTLSRPDGQQDLSSLDVALPPGLLGNIGSVPLCSDAQAAAGTCAAASQIGHVAGAVGTGSSPLDVPQAGKAPTAVYLAGPYKGAPFSLSIVVPAQAGPFDLGTVVVRAALFVDKHDAHASVKSDPIPTIVDGVPLHLQKLNVTVDRPGFMLAPSSCNPMQVTGTATSSVGTTATLASHFQVGSCASLRFAPKLSAGVTGGVSHKHGKTSVFASKPNGIKLHVKLAYPSGPLGSQANIAKVKVELPKQLPSRLSTLQKACTAAQFAANPAGCPAESIVGSATATTPLLPVPLTGPAYFVSHGGDAFPSLTMVLQGYGVAVELVGTTLIRKGITSTTFKEVPDVPVSSFELTLPQGKFSALTANGDLCNPSVTKTVKKKVRVQVNGRMRTVLRKVKQQVSTSLTIPTEYIGQNGATLQASTPVAVGGCAKAKSAAIAKAKKKAKGEKG